MGLVLHRRCQLVEYADELCALADEGASDEVRFKVSACGGEGAGLDGIVQVKPAPAKQEVSFEPV